MHWNLFYPSLEQQWQLIQTYDAQHHSPKKIDPNNPLCFTDTEDVINLYFSRSPVLGDETEVFFIFIVIDK